MIAVLGAAALMACVKKKDSETKSIRSASGRLLVDEIVDTEAPVGFGNTRNTAANNVLALADGFEDPVQGGALLAGKANVALCFLDMAEIPGVDPDNEAGRTQYIAKAAAALQAGDTRVLGNAVPVSLGAVENDLRSVPSIAPALARAQEAQARSAMALTRDVSEQAAGPNYGAVLSAAAGIGIVGYNLRQGLKVGEAAMAEANIPPGIRQGDQLNQLNQLNVLRESFTKAESDKKNFGFYKRLLTPVKRLCWGKKPEISGAGRNPYLRVGTMALCMAGTAAAAFAVDSASKTAGLVKESEVIPVKPIEELIASPEFAASVQAHMQTAAISLELDDAQFETARGLIRARGAGGIGVGCRERILAAAALAPGNQGNTGSGQ